MRTLLLLILLAGCPSAGDDGVAQADADDFAERLAGDLADLVATAVDVVSSADDLSSRDTVHECYPTVGTCSFCYDLDGTPLTGTFAVTMEDAPCGVAWEIAGRSLNYSVASTAFTGSWTATGLGGDYTVEATGERDALLGVSSPRGGDHEFDSSYAMTMTVGVVDLAAATLALEMTYGGFTGRTWQVAVAGDADGLEGTASTSDGISCTVSAGYEAPTVRCTATDS